MYKVETSQYDRVAALFQEMIEYHLSIAAVCSRTVPGEVWIDAIDNPSILRPFGTPALPSPAPPRQLQQTLA